MTTEQRAGIVQRVARILDERISAVRWFRQNACMRHGLPFEENGELRVVIEGGAQQPPATTAGAVASALAPAAAKGGPMDLLNSIPGWLKAATLLAGGYGVNAYFNQSPEPAKPDVHIEQHEAVERPDPNGSLLQYLEDNLLHLPEGR